jgi:hypothetical protein
MKTSELRQIIREEIEQFLGRGGSKEVFSSSDSNLVTKKFTEKINKKNLVKEKELGDKYPNYIAKIQNIDFKTGVLTQEKLNTTKLKTDIKKEFINLPEEIQDLFDESGLDDEFEFFTLYPEYITNSDLQNEIVNLNTFVQVDLIQNEGLSKSSLDYPNINNVGYDKKGKLKMLEVFY